MSLAQCLQLLVSSEANMTTKLIPLSEIPGAHCAREKESDARHLYKTNAAALRFAPYRIEVAPGCHGRPYHDPPVIGWVLTKAAAEALASRVTRLQDGSTHRRTTYSYLPDLAE